jgi:hypothetical protein
LISPLSIDIPFLLIPIFVVRKLILIGGGPAFSEGVMDANSGQQNADGKHQTAEGSQNTGQET